MRKKLFRRSVCALISAAIVITSVSVLTFADNGASPSANLPVVESNIYLPRNMGGCVITPTVDFAMSEEETAEDIDVQLDKIYEQMALQSMNTVIINTYADGKILFADDVNAPAESDPIMLAADKARNSGFYVYMIFDVSGVSGGNADLLSSELHKFALRYNCDGIILDGYYAQKTVSAYASYMQNGSGIGYENYLYDYTSYLVSTASDVIHLTNNSIAVGLLADDIWANSSTKDDGSKTTAEFEALVDGYADTRDFVESNLIDFVAVGGFGSIDDKIAPYKTVIEWWNDICKSSSIPMYTVHDNSLIGTEGWENSSEIADEMRYADSLDAFNGGYVTSYSALAEDKAGSTTALKEYLSNNSTSVSEFGDLELLTPRNLSFTTFDSDVEFMGKYPEGRKLEIDGKGIKLGDNGYFYYTVPLEIGTNYIDMNYNGTNYKYRIERRVSTIYALDNTVGADKSLTLDGGTFLTVTAYAYKDAAVTASIWGQSVSLKDSGLYEGSSEMLNSDYVKFTGKIQLPENASSAPLNIGKLTVTSVLGGYSKTMYGAEIIINPVAMTDKLEYELGETEMSGNEKVVGTMDPFISDTELTSYVKLNSDYTPVYSGTDYSEYPSCNEGQLLSDTIDYYAYTAGDYYITKSGHRFLASDCSLVDDYGIGTNRLVVKATGNLDSDSYIKFRIDQRTSYTVETAGKSIDTTDGQVKSFDAEYVYITFDNVTSVTDLPSFEYNMVFKGGKWEIVTVDGVNKFRLVLELRQKGVYGGNGAYINGFGDLVLTFQPITSSFSNYNIVIDPGHGADGNIWDSGAVGYVEEAKTNAKIAELLSSKLTLKGASVTVLDTTNISYSEYSRQLAAREKECDLFISLHCAKSSSADDKGITAYYFTPFSQPLASYISSSLGSYFDKNVNTAGNNNNGAVFSYSPEISAGDFPSVIVSCGFVSNKSDGSALADNELLSGFADSITSAVESYINQSNISIFQSDDYYINLPESTVAQTTAPQVYYTDPVVTTVQPSAVTTTTTLPPVQSSSESSEVTTIVDDEEDGGDESEPPSTTTPFSSNVAEEPDIEDIT